MFKKIRNLSNLYPVIAYDEEDNLFLITAKDETRLGFGFWGDPIAGFDEGIAQRLEVLLNLDLPKNSIMEFSLMATPNINDLILENELTALSITNNDFLKALLKNKNEFFSKAASDGFGFIPTILRNFILVVTVIIPCKDHNVGENELIDAKNLSLNLEQTLNSAGFNLKSLNDKSFLKIITPFFNAHKFASWKSFDNEVDSDKPLSNQIFDFDSYLKVSDEKLEVGGYQVNTFSVKRMPEFVTFGGALRYPSDILTGTRGIFEPFIITGSIYFSDSVRLKEKLNAKRQWVTNQAYGPLIKFMPKLALKKHGFDVLFSEIEKGQRPLRFNLTLTTFSKNEEDRNRTISQVRTYFKELGFELINDRFFILPIFLNALPFGGDFKAIRSLMRYKTLTSKEIIPLLPIFADSKGTGTSALNLVSRSGQLQGLSFFDSPTNYNVCIAAQSGSGKSFLVNEILVSFLSRGASCYVIDVGRSYEKLCKLLGGSFLSFGINSKVSLNPFYSIRDYNEEADMVTSLVSAMIAPNEKLSDYQQAQLKRIIGSLFNEYSNNLTLDILADTLSKNSDLRVKDMALQLHAFTSKGEYGKYFLGSNTLSFNDSLTVLELEELKGRKQLQQVVLLELIFQIQQNMYLGKRDRPKLIIIDEAWDLLRDGDIARFIETGYRRFRKYGGAAITVTQSINDLYSSQIGSAIAENSSSLYLLGQKNETIESIKKNNRLSLSDGEYELLKSVHTVKGAYSEIFVVSELGNLIGRLIVDPFRALLYSTNPQDINEIETLKTQGFTLEEAINKILKDRKQVSEND